jgi:uncharacterized SAM-binding protein YcdF (DUF218 family)
MNLDPVKAWILLKWLKAALLPPLSLILLMSAGLVLLRSRPKTGKALVATGLVLLYALSTGLVAGALTRLLEVPPLPADADLSNVGAIVVLGAGRYRDAPEYGGDTASSLALERLRYGAWMARRTALPILVAGGAPDGGEPEAHFMKRILEEEFGVAVRWVEDRSFNTRENAQNSAAILRAAGVQRVLLITHAWHMPRAKAAFEAAGIAVVPAGTRFASGNEPLALRLLPDASHLHQSTFVLHEIIGLLGYRLLR